MLATANKRTQSEIERAAELTRVEREPLSRRQTESHTSEASFDEEPEDGIEEECSDDEEDGEDVFESCNDDSQATVK